ncbi:ABC transporter ATP-binding protein [Tepidiforma sp.]|uniref:ABC transporter ATP-binding protein n=1 Tax=Tepidiforma sp. TaxID=2682230 RepID=UPI002ADE62C8|nr:ABC transporter ATP-binding protein [Tepidiforma sp.]
MTEEALDLRAGERLILGHLRARWPMLAVAFGAGLSWGLLRLVEPYLVGLAIDHAIVTGDLGLLTRYVVAFVVVVAVLAVCAGTRRYWAMRTSYRIETDLRLELYDRVNRLSFDYHDRTATGQLMSRGSADLREIQAFLVNIPINAAYLLMAVGAFVLLVMTSVSLAVLAMAVFPVVTWLSVRFFSRLEPGTERVQQDLADVASVTEETIAGARLVRAFGREEYEVSRMRAAAERVRRDAMEVVRLRTTYGPLFFLLPGLGQLVVLAYGGWLVTEGRMSAGSLVAALQYLGMLTWPVQSLGELIASGQRAVVSAARVWNVLKEEPTVREQPHARPLPPGNGAIVFDRVTFGYRQGLPVLRGFSLEVPAGRSVALVGATGSGKSTVARLLPRFYDVDEGRILIDGADIRSLRLRDLRRNIGIVFEDTFLFSDTVRNNIAYGRLDATDAQIERAARLAHAHEFIERLENGYETVVGEQGFSLSGGQRQRIAIARAILMEPRVLILDDATSSVDARMEEEIRTALKEVMAGRTTLIISHRLSTISLADQVVLVDEGRVAATGTHDELMRSSARYREVLGQLEAVAS